MKKDYIYLSCSLPYLDHNSKLKFDTDSFIQNCHSILTKQDINLLDITNLSIGNITIDDYAKINHPLIDYYKWEFTLRNKFIKKLNNKKEINNDKFLRNGGIAFDIDSLIDDYFKLNPLKAEQLLVKEKFKILNLVSANHFFDIVFLTSYLVKMKILTVKNSWATKLGTEKYYNICQTLEYK